jgi:hypothetical protein
MKYTFECDESMVDLVKTILYKEMGIDVKPEAVTRRKFYGRRNNQPRGDGFGDRVWRIVDGQVQASFARPCAEAFALKHRGFRWCQSGGYWYNDFNDGTVKVLLEMGLSQVVVKGVA